MKKSDEAGDKTYIIQLAGHLDESWTDWFYGLDLFYKEESNKTIITGEIVDQSALHGILKKIRDLGLPLISISLLDNTTSSDIEEEIGGRNEEE